MSVQATRAGLLISAKLSGRSTVPDLDPHRRPTAVMALARPAQVRRGLAAALARPNRHAVSQGHFVDFGKAKQFRAARKPHAMIISAP